MEIDGYSDVLTELKQGVLHITFNRPEKLNAVRAGMAQALLDALRVGESDAEVRSILISARGRAFCAGRDVAHPPTDAELELVQAVSLALTHGTKPVVCAVHGWVVGAGLEWMLCADIVYAARESQFKLPEASLGVFVTGGITATLPKTIGLARAKALMLLGEPWSAQQAQDWGMVWGVEDAPTLFAKASQAACKLAALAPAVSSGFKRVLNTVGLDGFDEAIRQETAQQLALGRP